MTLVPRRKSISCDTALMKYVMIVLLIRLCMMMFDVFRYITSDVRSVYVCIIYINFSIITQSIKKLEHDI